MHCCLTSQTRFVTNSKHKSRTFPCISFIAQHRRHICTSMAAQLFRESIRSKLSCTGRQPSGVQRQSLTMINRCCAANQMCNQRWGKARVLVAPTGACIVFVCGRRACRSMFQLGYCAWKRPERTVCCFFKELQKCESALGYYNVTTL